MPACQVNVLEDANWTLARTIQDCCRAPYCYSLRVASVSPIQAACWFRFFVLTEYFAELWLHRFRFFVLTEYFAELWLHSSDNAVRMNVDFPDAFGPTTSIQGILCVFGDKVKMLRILYMWSFFLSDSTVFSSVSSCLLVPREWFNLSSGVVIVSPFDLNMPLQRYQWQIVTHAQSSLVFARSFLALKIFTFLGFITYYWWYIIINCVHNHLSKLDSICA